MHKTTFDGEVKIVDDGSVGEVILAIQGQTEVGGGHDGVVVLDDDLVRVDALEEGE